MYCKEQAFDTNKNMVIDILLIASPNFPNVKYG